MKFYFIFLTIWIRSYLNLLICDTASAFSSASHKHYQSQKIHNHPTIAFTLHSHAYASYWDELLLEEYQETAQELKDRRKYWSRQRLEQNGMSLFDVTAEPESELLGEKMVRIVVPKTHNTFSHHSKSMSSQTFYSGKKTLKQLFARGDALIMTPEPRYGGSMGKIQIDPVPRECLVVEVGSNWLIVGVGPSWPHGLWEMRKHPGQYIVRVDRAAPQGSLRAQRKALSRLSSGKYCGDIVKLLAEIHAETNTGVETNNMQNDLEKNIDNDYWNKTSRNLISNKNETDLKLKIKEVLEQAKQETTFVPNKSQEEAITNALSQRLALIRGPPGTGKTKTAALVVATALQMQKSNLYKPNSNKSHPRILAVTHSNNAADVLLQSLLQMNVPAIRLGRPATVSSQVQHRTIPALVEQLPHIRSLRRSISQSLDDPLKRSEYVWELKQAIQDAQDYMKQQAPVIVTTCIGAWQLVTEDSPRSPASDMHEKLKSDDNDNFNPSLKFPLVVLDEAAQTTEPALVCALVAAQAQQLILVGDTRQLPPTVTSKNLQVRKKLALSPMARLEQWGIGEDTLQTQYRMTEELLEFPSRYFYQGLVKCDLKNITTTRNQLDETSLNPPKGFPWPKLILEQSQQMKEREKYCHSCFVQVGRGDSEVVHPLGGRSNPLEAQYVVQIIRHLQPEINSHTNSLAFKNSTKTPPPFTIGVITPYAKQVQLLQQTLHSPQHNFNKSSNRFQIQIGTVDSFQGQEKDLIILSTVRSNPLRELGFVRDARRLCVALTRAKRGLIVLGDGDTLKQCRHWRSLLEFYDKRGCILDASFLDSWFALNTNKAMMNTTATQNIHEEVNTQFIRRTDDRSSNTLLTSFLNQEDPLYGLFALENELIE